MMVRSASISALETKSATALRVILEESTSSFLYEEGDNLIFMDSTSFEQVAVPRSMVGDQAAFLQDGMEVTVNSHDSEPISIELPDKVTVTVLEADAVVKGQTASSSYKPAIVDNGIRVMVPPHIEAGTRIVVRPEDSSYVERAKD